MMHQQRGTTLLEILLAMAISTALIASVATIIARNRILAQRQQDSMRAQETLYYLNHSLSRIFSQALHSPCQQSFDQLIDSQPPQFHYARKGTQDHLSAQTMPWNYMIDRQRHRIGTGDVPLLIVGIAGHEYEPRDRNGVAFSKRLGSIVEQSTYLMVIQAAQPIRLALPPDIEAHSPESNAVTGGTQSGGALSLLGTNKLPTEIMQFRVKSAPVPYLITNCRQGDIFVPTQAVSNNAIPLAPNLYFSGQYRRDETVLYPLTLYAYYISQTGDYRSRSWSRKNLSVASATHRPTSQPLIAGVHDLSFTWVMRSNHSTLQETGIGLFSTADILSSGMSFGEFQHVVIGVEASMVAQQNNDTPQQPSIHSAPASHRMRATYAITAKAKP